MLQGHKGVVGKVKEERANQKTRPFAQSANRRGHEPQERESIEGKTSSLALSRGKGQSLRTKDHETLRHPQNGKKGLWIL